jgi:hypothetical protein
VNLGLGLQQLTPRRLNGPPDPPIRMLHPQRRDGRHRVQYIAHGANSHDQYAKRTISRERDRTV